MHSKAVSTKCCHEQLINTIELVRNDNESDFRCNNYSPGMLRKAIAICHPLKETLEQFIVL